LFNSQFELYGRKVVLKPFKAQGDFLQEIQGQDEQGAQADAATARGFNPFADITTLPSQPYQEGLIQNKIMAFGGLYMSDAWFNQHAPYAWSSTFPDDDAVAKAAVSAVCHRMAGMPAIFAGDSATQAKTRVFGLLTPENPVYSAAGDYIQAHLKSECGVVVAKRISYALDISTAQQQTTNAIAQLKSAGVTTVICGCDPVAPIYLAQAADNQSYHPEWATLWWGDPFNRAIASDQSSHGIALGTQGQSPAEATTEAYRAFKLSAPSAQPAEGDFTVVYYDLLLLFNGLQAAGPNLNPQSFQDGLDSLPPTAIGDDGSWRFGPGLHVPMSTFRITWWSPTTASGYDGKAGAYLNCEGGRWFSLSNPDVGSGQPHCFGR
jgi:hypothetical protein